MVYKCCIINCCSISAGEERTAVLNFPKEESLRKIWIKSVNRKDWEPTPSSFLYIKYFEEQCQQYLTQTFKHNCAVHLAT